MLEKKMFNFFIILGIITNISSMALSIYTLNKGYILLSIMFTISLIVTVIFRKPCIDKLPDVMVITIMLEMINLISIPLMLMKLA